MTNRTLACELDRRHRRHRRSLASPAARPRAHRRLGGGAGRSGGGDERHGTIDSSFILTARRRLVRLGLVAMAVPQLVTGAWAVLAIGAVAPAVLLWGAASSARDAGPPASVELTPRDAAGGAEGHGAPGSVAPLRRTGLPIGGDADLCHDPLPTAGGAGGPGHLLPARQARCLVVGDDCKSARADDRSMATTGPPRGTQLALRPGYVARACLDP
jgi:hypothetical protein